MSKSRYFTRKEIAAANEVSEDTIARKETMLGLAGCRDRACQRPVRYHADRAEECLKQNGMQVP